MGETSDSNQTETLTAAQPEVAGETQEAAMPDLASEPPSEPVVEPAVEEEEQLAVGEATPAPSASADGEVAEEPGDEPAEPIATEESSAPAGVAESKPAKVESSPVAEQEPVSNRFVEAQTSREALLGKVIGWNSGGFHVLIEGITAFCPRSEMEMGQVQDEKSYLDQSYSFRVIRVEKQGRRVVVSRAAVLKGALAQGRADARSRVKTGSTVHGTVASLTDFGAFVDLGGVQGLVHVSEISRQRVGHPSERLKEGDEIAVKVLKVERDGKRISLSMKALEPDPWADVNTLFSEGSVVEGKVERTASFGAFVELAPGLTGLLPASGMNLPGGSSPARVFPSGRKLAVQVMSIDPRRKRISLALEGSQLEGSRSDYEQYKRDQNRGTEGFNTFAAALQKVDKTAD